MSAAAARKKRRHQERLEAKARAALAGIVVDPVGAGIAETEPEPSANKPGIGIWGQIVRDRGGADAAVAGGRIKEGGGGGDGEGGAGAEGGRNRRESSSSLGVERPGGSEGLDAVGAADAEGQGGEDKAEGDEGARDDDDSPEPSPARRPRHYSGSDADGVVTTQPTGEC